MAKQRGLRFLWGHIDGVFRHIEFIFVHYESKIFKFLGVNVLKNFTLIYYKVASSEITVFLPIQIAIVMTSYRLCHRIQFIGHKAELCICILFLKLFGPWQSLRNAIDHECKMIPGHINYFLLGQYTVDIGVSYQSIIMIFKYGF